VINPHALDGRLYRRHYLELPPPHALPDRDGVFLRDLAALVHVPGFDLAHAHQVGAELPRTFLQVGGSFGGGSELVASLRHLTLESGVLLRDDVIAESVDFLDVDRPATRGGVPLVPPERWRRDWRAGG